ncbi:hypothetical protein BDV59DRAFT_186140 [Aspergillus ambiguus]|uniref:inositol polyphosphate kinase KCS1 n=1 Tax=Aspergillus ambiguus TaxID=176160 RepID=UPI003CCDDFFA
MSRPPSVSESTLSRPVVTPAASAQHDCSEGPDFSRAKPRRHHVWDQHHHPPEAPSPSRAESPTAHQWAKPVSTFALKRSSTAPLDKFPRPHSPPLSERDSIFATHYLPSDPDANTTPQLPPVEDVAENDAPGTLNLASVDRVAAEPAPVPSTKVLPRSLNQEAPFPMEVDASAPLVPPTPPIPSDPDARLRKPHEVLDRSAHLPAWESMQPLRKTSSDGAAAAGLPPSQEPLSHRSATSGPPNDPSLSLPVHDLDYTATISHRDPAGTWSERSSRESILEGSGPIERSSSRSRRGRVESSIEANLTNAEPASHVRSRKSSHYLGLFKENTTSPDRKRREDRGRWLDEAPDARDAEQRQVGPSSKSPHAAEQTTSPAEGAFALERTGLRRNSKSLSQLTLADHPLFTPPSEAERSPNDEVMKSPRRALPRSLLEEIRNFHLTPGGARGSSFSKSIPTQYAEGGRDYISAKGDSRFGHLSPSSGPDASPGQGPAQFEEEEDEQIASAVYFPHERVTVSDEVDPVQPFSDDQPGVGPFDVSPAKSSLGLASKRHSLVDEPEAHHVDISLRSKNDSRILHGDLQEIQAPPLDELTEKTVSAISERSAGDSTCDSEYDSGMSVQDEVSSLTDEAEVTPTATPTQRHRIVRPRRTHGSSAPLGAVELKPYRHQVGGHTTVFRFSRRAVCKQLNNRENEFYERIERRHPDMLMFLPRYIGVLNVTFSKNLKKQKPFLDTSKGRTGSNYRDDGNKSQDATSLTAAIPHDAVDHPRIFSQKQVTGIIPKVILENNRHIIPADLFSRSQRPRTADGIVPIRHRFSQSAGVIQSGKQAGGSWDDKTHIQPFTKPKISWGATTVNRQLQEQVLREVFSPPAIHHHRRHARGHVNLPRTTSDGVRRRGNLSEDQTASSRRNAPTPPEPPRSAAIDIAKESGEGPGLSSSASTALDASHNRLEKIRSQESQPRSNSLSRTRQVRRRHSGSGLQRRGSMTPGKNGGDLMFFEDDGYGGDREDEIFSMEGDASMTPSHNRSEREHFSNLATPKVATTESTQHPRHVESDAQSKSPVRSQEKDDSRFQLPTNPKEAQTRKDDRVQFFLLLEDLTAGMNKPCVLDLKMGTRQYGIEADEKKRKSQRRKCQSTTSQQLGVRLCGMQTWNVKRQEYTFEDKYFGRDLKSGREFQDALTRFLYDGVSYTSVAKKIPVILEKLARLENMIRRLKRYRLYASSLLILYDGEQASLDTSVVKDVHMGTTRNVLSRRGSDDGHNNLNVQLKIVDFANCVTGEDEISPTAPCPPQHPDDIDRGYLRGLRTLRMYFQRILKEVSHDEYIERGEGEAIAMRTQLSGHDDPSDRYWDDGVMESDPGEVSF